MDTVPQPEHEPHADDPPMLRISTRPIHATAATTSPPTRIPSNHTIEEIPMLAYVPIPRTPPT